MSATGVENVLDHWSQKILGFPENILSSHLQSISGKFVHEFPGNILH